MQRASQATSSRLYPVSSVRFVLITPNPPALAQLNVNVRKVSSAPLQTPQHLPALVKTHLTDTSLKNPTCILTTGRLETQTNCSVTHFPPEAPPSAPRELTSTSLSADGKLQLSWSPPLVTGGRSDLTYSVVCEHCEGALCIPCGEKIRYDPGSTGLGEATVIISDLDSHLNYTFTVEAHSGVSHYGTNRPTVTITTALDYTGEPSHMLLLLWFNIVYFVFTVFTFLSME